MLPLTILRVMEHIEQHAIPKGVNVATGSGSVGSYISTVMPLPKPFLDISKIEVFDGKNYKRYRNEYLLSLTCTELLLL